LSEKIPTIYQSSGSTFFKTENRALIGQFAKNTTSGVRHWFFRRDFCTLIFKKRFSHFPEKNKNFEKKCKNLKKISKNGIHLSDKGAFSRKTGHVKKTR